MSKRQMSHSACTHVLAEGPVLIKTSLLDSGS